MRQNRVAKPYAKALFDLAVENKSLDAVFNDVTLMLSVYRESKELQVFLSSPVIKEEKKNEVLQNLFAAKVSKETISFLTILFKKSREYILGAICEAFIELYNHSKGIVVANVTAATKLTEAQKASIIKYFKLGNVSINEIQIVEKIDPSILGGFIATVNNLQIDRSVKSQLSKVKKAFETTAYEKKF